MSLNELPKVRNNSIVIFTSQFLSLFLNIISISLAARYLGVEDFGKFNYYLAIVGVGAKLIDFGFNPIIFRELSKPENSGKYLGSILVFRILTFFVLLSLVSIISLLLNIDIVKLTLIIILSINILFSNKFTNIRELIIIPFKVELKLHIPMFAVILDNVLLLLFVYLMPYFNGGMTYFVIVYVFSNVPGILIIYYFLFRRYKFQLKFDLNELKYLLSESYPLIGFIIISYIYSILDVLLLENFASSSSVGIYSSAIRLIVPLKIIPNVFVITLFSIIVKNIDKQKYNQQITNFVIKLFFIFSSFFFAFMYINAKEVILIIFGEEYIKAELPLIILSAGIFFDFFSFFVLDLFTAYNNQKFNFVFILIVTIVMLVANIVLISSYDFVGASIARVLSAVIGFIFLVIILKRKIKFNLEYLNIRMIISLFSFALSIFLLQSLFPVVNIILSSILFCGMILLSKVFSKGEMEIIINLTGKNKLFSILKSYYKIEV